MTRFSLKFGSLVCLAMFAGHTWAQSDPQPLPPPMVPPPPPRMLDSATDTVEESGATVTTTQRQHCQSLLDQINGLPGGQQWSQGKSAVTTADGRTYSTLERQSDRKRLEEAYRQQCAQAR